MRGCGISRIQCCLWFHVELLMLGLHCLPILCEFIMIFASLSISWIQFRPIMIWGRSYAICWQLSLLSILHQWDFQRVGRTRNCGKSGKVKQNVKIYPQKIAGSEKSSYLCSTSTRQASQRCSNVRVVLFLYMSVSYYSAPPIEVTTHIHRGVSMGAE